jgi:hypothetical protein
MKRFGIITLIVIAGSLMAATGRYWYPVTISQITSGSVGHTHAQIGGYVTYVRHELDNDWHIQVCDSMAASGTHCLVTEVIPGLPLKLPKVGSHVVISGITRYDKEHGWWEIHPIEKITGSP